MPWSIITSCVCTQERAGLKKMPRRTTLWKTTNQENHVCLFRDIDLSKHTFEGLCFLRSQKKHVIFFCVAASTGFSSVWTWGRRVFTSELGRRCHYKVLHPGTSLVKIWSNDIFLQFNISSCKQSCDSDQNTTTMLFSTLHVPQLWCFCWIQKNYLFQELDSFLYPSWDQANIPIPPDTRTTTTVWSRLTRSWTFADGGREPRKPSEEDRRDTGTASELSRGT